MFPETPSIGLIRQQTGFTRRSWLARAGQGFGLVPLLALERSRIRGADSAKIGGVLGETGPGKTRPGHTPGRAKSVIFLFMDTSYIYVYIYVYLNHHIYIYFFHFHLLINCQIQIRQHLFDLLGNCFS